MICLVLIFFFLCVLFQLYLFGIAILGGGNEEGLLFYYEWLAGYSVDNFKLIMCVEVL